MDSISMDCEDLNGVIWSSNAEYLDVNSPNFLLEDDWKANTDVIFNDRMFSESTLEMPSIQNEHSYSLALAEELMPVVDVKVEPMDDYHDIDPEIFLNTSSADSSIIEGGITIKHECPSPPLKNIIIPDAITTAITTPKVKVETNTTSGFSLPPTPPSSNSSDSDGSLSPDRSEPPPRPSKMARTRHSAGRSSSSSTMAIETSQYISHQEKGSTGELNLTEEELKTLRAEGYDIPKRLPLTKTEERTLKKIRRKIKNKISAQESRRKKKEYMDSLEKKVECFEKQMTDMKNKFEKMESSTRIAKNQVQQLYSIIRQCLAKHGTSTPLSMSLERNLELFITNNPQLNRSLR